MAFENQTFERILDRMLARIPDQFDKREGSVIYDMLAPTAHELSIAYSMMDMKLSWSMVDADTPTEYIERAAREIGIVRKEGSKANGIVSFTGVPGTLIPQDTMIGGEINSTQVEYLTSSDATIPENGEVSVGAVCITPGAIGNLPAGEIKNLVSFVIGVSEVINESAFAGGLNAETDDSLMIRIREKYSNHSSSGNEGDYIRWAKETPGIDYARVFPVWDGAGTVKLVILNTEKATPTQKQVVDVESYINSRKPICAEVTVVGGEEKAINITVKLTLVNKKLREVTETEIEQSIKRYFNDITFVEDTVRIVRVGERILDNTNIIEYENLTMNGALSNIKLEANQYPVLGSITFTYIGEEENGSFI